MRSAELLSGPRGGSDRPRAARPHPGGSALGKGPAAGDDPDELLTSALAEERLANARRIHRLRLWGVSALFALFLILGHVLGLRSWQGNLRFVLPYWLSTIALFVSSRKSERVARMAAWAVVFVDMPAVCLVQWGNFPNTPNPAAVAGFTMGIYVLLLVVQALSLDARAIASAAIVGATLEGILQHLASVEWGAIMASLVIMALAAIACIHGSRRITALIVRVMRDVRDAERAKREISQRDEFMAVASHELRTPLTALQLEIQGALRSVRKPGGAPIDVAVHKRLESIEAQGARLTRLIANLLDVSRITAGKMALELAPTNLAELGEHVVAQAKELLGRAGCVCTFTANGFPTGQWDKLRVEQVLTNLLENAIKYGPGKPIDVTVQIEGRWGVLSVRDMGPGVAPDNQERIFQRFERCAAGKRVTGLGLGLWIAREIVTAMSGTISVASQPGCGATFTVRLPI